MTLSMYQASVPPVIHGFANLINILNKGQEYADAKGIDPSVLLGSRLYPNMFPLLRQVQIGTDIPRRGIARLAGVEPSKREDNETSFQDLIDRVNDAKSYISDFTPDQIDGSEARVIEVPLRKETMTFQGQSFLLSFLLPNFYFHITTAYNILRHNGVELGKGDFLGALK
ncbi:DUF1993 domain-containing protein [Pseudobacteriovorax antillogorgiicola]|uniref:DUF1993 domain-containing protein n=1 Tax=Pseudobacteriovorax antillogorgiicola TaxID=1513793 RepID=A0A1Y6BET9_9BACT|nr:DUF1993 domain-containing protein [Pseudobacteriovorax antillogorgiicola]TCS57543.1 hypothetical protein EDD56_103283 [Pseudobacteriovorax antillogorgiicola]SME99889.1 hypothetical protein SAMN06296036_10350 [Pseudobacteriovorax antillogorgiicola]